MMLLGGFPYPINSGTCLKDRAEIINLRKDDTLLVPPGSVDKIKSTAK